MKRTLIILSTLFISSATMAQNEKYMNAMQEKVTAIDTTRDVVALQGLSAAFERIAEAEKTQWLPYYYAALAQVNAGYQTSQGKMGGNMEGLDVFADKAEQLLTTAETLTNNNSEIFVVKKMIATLRMLVDPMNRYMQYGPEAAEALETAKKLNPENPRVYLLEGQDKLFTPEQFGGSREEAIKKFEMALAKYDSFKPATVIDPNWGKNMTHYFLTLANK